MLFDRFLVEMSSFQATSSREGPAASTLLLVLHWSNKSHWPPVNLDTVQELILCHKLKSSYTCIIATRLCKALTRLFDLAEF